MLYEELTKEIIHCFYKVYNTLGYGFLEKVYENALLIELRKSGLKCENQVRVKVFYDEQIVGNYSADIFVENQVVLELKTAEFIREDDEFQLINYLKATKLEVGLLLNFGKKPEFRRKIFTNDRK